MIIRKRKKDRRKKTILPLFALFRPSYRNWLPFVNLFLFSYYIAVLLTSDSIFLALYITVYKYSLFNLPLDLELYVYLVD